MSEEKKTAVKKVEVLKEGQKFINMSDIEFKDISTEEWREYIYDKGFRLKIEHPIKLGITKSGSHRIWDGVNSFWIRPGFMTIIWKAKEGLPHFTF